MVKSATHLPNCRPTSHLETPTINLLQQSVLLDTAHM